jgi:hypothetical protein
LQELARAKEAAELDRQKRQAEKADKLEMARARAAQRQATTGIKKHKRGPTTAGAPLVAIAWEPVAAMPSPMPAFVPLPVALEAMPPYDPSIASAVLASDA